MFLGRYTNVPQNRLILERLISIGPIVFGPLLLMFLLMQALLSDGFWHFVINFFKLLPVFDGSRGILDSDIQSSSSSFSRGEWLHAGMKSICKFSMDRFPLPSQRSNQTLNLSNDHYIKMFTVFFCYYKNYSILTCLHFSVVVKMFSYLN